LTLLIDFYKESEYTPEAYESYLKNYDEKFEGLKELAELYEQRKQKA
jgi:proline dehydrogenase